MVINIKIEPNSDTKDCSGFIIQNNNKEILLVHDKRSNKWGPPKGHRKINETNFQAAVRELEEEANIIIDQTKKYKCINAGNVKLFLAFVNKNDINLNISSNIEIDQIKWFGRDELIKIKDELNSPTKIFINKQK